jgi:arylsulfatase
MVNNEGIPAYQGYLNRECLTLAEALKINGYNTYMSGKWHVGTSESCWPRQRGFDRYFGLISGASNYFNLNPYRVNQAPSTMALDDELYYPPDSGFYMTDAFTDYALEFLEEEKGKPGPFFLYLAYTAPHWPLHALPDDINRYRGTYLAGWDSLREARYRKLIQLELISDKWLLSPRFAMVPAWNDIPDEERDMWDLRMSVYAAMIDRMDQNIGRVLQKLKEIDEQDQTIILFLADN